MPDIFSYYRPYDSRNYRSVERRPRTQEQVTAEEEGTPYLYRRSYNNNGPLARAGRAVARTLDTGMYNTMWFGPNLIRKGYNAITGGPDVSLMQSVNDDRAYLQQAAAEENARNAGYALRGAYPAGTFIQQEQATAAPQGNATGAASSSSSKAATSPRKGETVASYWTRVTGLPWKAAREMGLSDGSYASNIEIYKGLKNGSITKESLAAMSEAQNAVPYESAPETYAMPAQPVIERPRLPFDEPADMTPPSEREMQMAAYGGYLPLIGFAPAAYACGGKMKRR